jgi:putative two-component system response regulator
MVKHRILIVDDDQTSRGLLAEVVEQAGWEAVTAADGREGVEKAADDISLVLMDGVMPVMNGFDACKAIKTRFADSFLPIMMITGLQSHEDLIKGLAAGADEFIGKPFDPMELTIRMQKLIQLKETYSQMESTEAVLYTIAALIESKDEFHSDHSKRVARFAQELGVQVGMTHDEVRDVYRAGLVHDIGYLVVSDTIITKMGPLTEDEFRVVQAHTTFGAKILSGLKSVTNLQDIALHHHERLDGSGYPDHLHGGEIKLPVRVTMTADIYDALIHRRHYRNAYTKEDAIALMQEMADTGKLDGALVNVFAEKVVAKIG